MPRTAKSFTFKEVKEIILKANPKFEEVGAFEQCQIKILNDPFEDVGGMDVGDDTYLITVWKDS